MFLAPYRQHTVLLPSPNISMHGPSPLGKPHGDTRTHVDLVPLVANKEVVHHACLVQVAQADHVIHTLGRVGVHGAEGAKVLCLDPVFLERRASMPVRGSLCRGQPTAPLSKFS